MDMGIFLSRYCHHYRKVFIVFRSDDLSLESVMKISEAKRIVRLLAWRSLIAQRSNRGGKHPSVLRSNSEGAAAYFSCRDVS